MISFVNHLRGAWEIPPRFTRKMTVEYKRVVSVPGVVLVPARLVGGEPRMDGFTTECTIEDESGRVLTEATLEWFLGFPKNKAAL